MHCDVSRDAESPLWGYTTPRILLLELQLGRHAERRRAANCGNVTHLSDQSGLALYWHRQQDLYDATAFMMLSRGS